ncbi:MAG: hypothetical protein ACUVS7_13905 [Bryobacteraceae bacterium]
MYRLIYPIFIFLTVAPMFGAVSFRAQLGAIISFCACVFDDVGHPIQNQPLNWSVSAVRGSGYHNHNSPIRSPGSLDPPAGSTTGPDGCARGVYYATDVAGLYWIEAWPYTSYGPAFDYMEIQVQVDPDLVELPNYHVYEKVSSPVSQYYHPLSYWGTFTAVYRLQQICEQFFHATGIVAGINDMSLPWGGRFDLGPAPPYNGTWWSPPHYEHMWGRNMALNLAAAQSRPE